MTKFVNRNNILTPSQFGFRENSSTNLAITTFYDKSLNNINDEKVTGSIFFDLKKAFDLVDTTILLKKLCHYGFRGPAFNLLQSYLTGRKICMKVRCNISKICKIDHGVLQGSALCPLLFSLYVNDLPNAFNLETTLFADDTNLHISHNNIKNLQSVVANEIKEIDSWMKLNKLIINYKKSCYMLVGKKRTKLTNFKLCINHYPIELKNSIKYLGIHKKKNCRGKLTLTIWLKSFLKFAQWSIYYIATFLYQLFE